MKKLKKAEAKKVVTIQQLENLKGDAERQHSVAQDVQEYRCEALQQVALANAFMNSFSLLSPWMDKN